MTAQDGWDPDQYNRFAAEREAPFWDLVDLLVPADSPRLVDLGCGDGRLTAELHGVVGASDHRAVLERWAGSLRPGGQLAVQVPSNADHPSHRVAAELASELLNEPPPDPVDQNVLRPEEYALVLASLGFEVQHVRLQVYLHRLGSTADVVEWVKGTSLTRFKAAFGEQGWPAFVDLYRSRLLALLGEQAPYVYPFKRILMWGRLA